MRAAEAQAQKSDVERELDRCMEARIEDADEIRRRKLEFDRDGYTRFGAGELISGDLMGMMTREADDLLEHFAIRRDLHLESTGNSPRYMSNVPQRFIEENGLLIPLIYNSASMREYVGKIAGDTITSCFKDEEYVINRLERPGDTHGWHWGDYPYTIIWITKAPPLEQGGLLQCVPHTVWNKQDPRINWWLLNNPIKNYFHYAGDAYLLRSDTTLHRVTPVIGENCTRIILNTCWGGVLRPGNQDHETVQAAFV